MIGDNNEREREFMLTVMEELPAIRANLQRIAEALEEANRLEGNHPSRI